MIIDVPSDDPSVVAKEVWIDAPPEIVYGLFTDAGRLVLWIGIAATVDPRDGGVFSFDANGRDVMRGTFVELVPFTRIVFTWGWENTGAAMPPGSSTVEITLAPEKGGTRLCLMHRGLKPELVDKHRFGWGHYLARLAARAQGVDPGADACATLDTHHAV